MTMKRGANPGSIYEIFEEVSMSAHKNYLPPD